MTEDKKSFLERLGKKSPKDIIRGNEKPTIGPKDDLASHAVEDSIVSREKNNFMDHLIRSRSDLCFQVMGRDTTGRIAWYFILVDKEKKEQFLAHKQGDSYDLADYGKIITSGYGEIVPDDVKEMLKEKYGFDNF
jgi:hypothetical protein